MMFLMMSMLPLGCLAASDQQLVEKENPIAGIPVKWIIDKWDDYTKWTRVQGSREEHEKMVVEQLRPVRQPTTDWEYDYADLYGEGRPTHRYKFEYPYPYKTIYGKDFEAAKKTTDFEVEESDLLFYKPSKDKEMVDGHQIADYGWHECLGGLPTFIKKWYEGKPGYPAFLEKAKTAFAHYKHTGLNEYIFWGRIFEKFSDDGNTAYLFLRRNIRYKAPGYGNDSWVVEAYTKGEMPVVDKIFSEQVEITHAVLPPARRLYMLPRSGSCLKAQCSTFEPKTNVALQHFESKKNSNLRIEIFPYQTYQEKEYISNYMGRGSPSLAKSNPRFAAGIQRYDAKKEETERILHSYLAAEFKRQAHKSGKQLTSAENKNAMSALEDKAESIYRNLYFHRQLKHIVEFNTIQKMQFVREKRDTYAIGEKVEVCTRLTTQTDWKKATITRYDNENGVYDLKLDAVYPHPHRHGSWAFDLTKIPVNEIRSMNGEMKWHSRGVRDETKWRRKIRGRENKGQLSDGYPYIKERNDEFRLFPDYGFDFCVAITRMAMGDYWGFSFPCMSLSELRKEPKAANKLSARLLKATSGMKKPVSEPQEEQKEQISQPNTAEQTQSPEEDIMKAMTSKMKKNGQVK